MHKPLAIFDIDGTIFRSALMFELFRGLVAHNILPGSALLEIDEHHRAWLNRRGAYLAFKEAFVGTYMKHIRGLRVEDVARVSHMVMHEHKERVYVYTRELVTTLSATHTLIAISGSPLEIVQEFQRHWSFDYAFGSVYEIQNGFYTGESTGMVSENKTKKLNEVLAENGFTLENSVGIGDTESDIYFLEMVEHPIAFNPNRELHDHARARGWKIVVERKDVIYEL